MNTFIMCKLCNAIFVSISDFISHLRYYHGKNSKYYKLYMRIVDKGVLRCISIEEEKEGREESFSVFMDNYL